MTSDAASELMSKVRGGEGEMHVQQSTAAVGPWPRATMGHHSCKRMQDEAHPANLLSKSAFTDAIFAGRRHVASHQLPDVGFSDGSVIVRFQTW